MIIHVTPGLLRAWVVYFFNSVCYQMEQFFNSVFGPGGLVFS